jgi:hypothetical protein
MARGCLDCEASALLSVLGTQPPNSTRAKPEEADLSLSNPAIRLPPPQQLPGEILASVKVTIKAPSKSLDFINSERFFWSG